MDVSGLKRRDFMVVDGLVDWLVCKRVVVVVGLCDSVIVSVKSELQL